MDALMLLLHLSTVGFRSWSMKGAIGFLFFLLFLAGFFLVFIQGKQMASQNLPAGGEALTGVRWQPVYIGAEAVPPDAGLHVRFGLDGSIKGHSGCNTFFGSLEKSESGVTVGPLGSTRMACPEPIMSRESAFHDALQRTTIFEVSGERLTCLDDDRKLLLELVATDDQ